MGGGIGANALRTRAPPPWDKLLWGACEWCYRYSHGPINMFFSRQGHLCPPLLLQGPTLHSSPISQRKCLSPMPPQQSPSTSQASHPLLCRAPTTATTPPAISPLAALVECAGKTSSHYHTPFITPLPAWSVAAKLLCKRLVSYPFYHTPLVSTTPVIRFYQYQN